MRRMRVSVAVAVLCLLASGSRPGVAIGAAPDPNTTTATPTTAIPTTATPTTATPTTASPTSATERWAVGITVSDEGEAFASWEPAPGEAVSYMLVLEASDGDQVRAQFGPDVREGRVALAEPALHVAKAAWVVANYDDGRNLRSESTMRDAVDLDGPGGVFLEECLQVKPWCTS
jgi:hypothetical protein